jgi:hypothetical protein
MRVATKRKAIGLDRKIKLEWLDATADWAAQGFSIPEIRSKLHELLEREVAGEGSHSARGKTITVLLHVWVLVPDHLVPLRDDGLRLLRGLSGQDRLPLHWGMCIASYPFFRDVASTSGRLLALQGTAALSQITQRMAGVWGERSTLIRAVQRVLRSLVLWGILHETSDRGVFAPAPKRPVKDSARLSPWLLEASILNSGRRVHSLQSLLTSTALFPFALNANPQDVLANPRLELHRQDLDEHLVLLKGAM